MTIAGSIDQGAATIVVGTVLSALLLWVVRLMGKMGAEAKTRYDAIPALVQSNQDIKKHLGTQDVKLDAIVQQTTLTNGRVATLEDGAKSSVTRIVVLENVAGLKTTRRLKAKAE